MYCSSRVSISALFFLALRGLTSPSSCNSICVALKQTLTREIVKLIEAGYTDFLSGMAEGADTWAAMVVLALKKENPALKLHCVLPCEGQADGWSASARELYHSILEQADEVVYVNREYSKGCMLERNRYLVDHAACLLAVYNGEWRGGTAMTVRYARKLNRTVHIIDPVSCAVM
ncbi:DUF1273 family protein [bacterium 1XD42-1]|nr:DUF1273 family protein [bacterium 1XD42-8]RKJ62519.1 DUF1273 family protein [bacterium 1XD42-1]